MSYTNRYNITGQVDTQSFQISNNIHTVLVYMNGDTKHSKKIPTYFAVKESLIEAYSVIEIVTAPLNNDIPSDSPQGKGEGRVGYFII